MVAHNDIMQRCAALNTIPKRKVLEVLQKILDECVEDQGKKVGNHICDNCRVKSIAINRFAESNIPVSYWDLSMKDNFKGFSALLKKYEELTLDINKTYMEGKSLILQGNHGVGKTFMSCEVLKHSALVGFHCLYSTLSDIVNLIANTSSADKTLGRKELMSIDFLVIDEFDSRWFSTDNSADLFGRILEDIIRARIQNKLPTLLATNSAKFLDSFPANLKKSLESLVKKITVFPVLGSDFRGKEDK